MLVISWAALSSTTCLQCCMYATSQQQLCLVKLDTHSRCERSADTCEGGIRGLAKQGPQFCIEFYELLTVR
jgi:hypothetical protein